MRYKHKSTTKITLGKAVTKDLAAIGVQNKFDKIIFSSSTLCSFNTAIAFTTVFPVPKCLMKKHEACFNYVTLMT